MPWPTIVLKDLAHFSAVVGHIGTHGPVATLAYACRGQCSAAWDLQPSLSRLFDTKLGREGAARIEQDCVRAFSECAHQYIPNYELPHAKDTLDWWALMQHHHAPSRLLDWSASPFVAAYFACEDRWDEDGVMWMTHLHALVTEMEIAGSPPIKVFWPSRPSHRMVVQQGLFIYAEDIMTDIEQQIDSTLRNEHAAGYGEVYRKIVVPKELKPQLLRYLRAMNITAASLFPGVDGLGRGVAELARLSRVYPHLNVPATDMP